EMGRVAVEQLDKGVTEKRNTAAVMGGPTMGTVAEKKTTDFAKGRELLFVPGRGGIGEDLDNQANTNCDKMARKTNSKRRVLYDPEQLGEEAYRSLLKEPAIQEGLRIVQSANAIILGIGDAVAMAKRRHT
ncbi:sugar-binding domain-containing protein, partial [Listeria monocytogenes]|uniref:sugar-binding domain-containing protein n=1 Tax=Listeria monocytogenes TaxID=1639 RepID=UPI0025B6E638